MCLNDCLNLYFTTVVFVLFAFNSSPSWGSSDLICVQKGPCNCTTEDGGVIDLAPLMEHPQTLIASSKTYLYVYSPCIDSSLASKVSNDCNEGYGLCYFVANASASKPITITDVITNKILGKFERLAVNDEGVFRVNEAEEIEVVYKNFNNGVVTTSVVKLHCNKENSVNKLMVEKSDKFEHVLILSSEYACKQLPHHMSGTAVFFLILFIVAIMYFLGGFLVLKYIRGAKGVETIPNHEFWCGLPELTKNAFDNLRNCCRQNGNTGPGTYESI